MDKDFLKELVTKHKSGLDILAGAEQFERPNAQDAAALEELLRVLSRIYDFIVVDAGNIVNRALAALYAGDTLFLVTNPDLPSVRNAQRFVERVRQLGAGGERIRVLLNRASDQILIAPRQIETALGYSIHHTFSSDYRTVSAALNSGVPLTLANHSEIRAVRRVARNWSASRRKRSTQHLPREPSSWEFFRHQGRRTRDEGPNRWHIRHRRILPLARPSTNSGPSTSS